MIALAAVATRAATLGVLALAGVVCGYAWLTAGATPEPERAALARLTDPPLGLPAVPLPGDQLPSAKRISLGRELFLDPRLSKSDTVSCASCHLPEEAFTQAGQATPAGTDGRPLRRNAPTILNVGYQTRFFHDGRASSLEEQAIAALFDPREMANTSEVELEAEIASIPHYRSAFEDDLAETVTLEGIASAFAAWERTIVAGDSRFDRWRFGHHSQALSETERAGFALFTGKARCASCHTVGTTTTLLTDGQFHNTGVGYLSSPNRRRATTTTDSWREADLGRFEVTGDSADVWRFKTPSLRNVAVTGPYMHDGSLRTLEDVVRFYVLGGVPHPGIDPLMGPIDLTLEDQAALVAFLRSLTSEDLEALRQDARSVAVGN